MSFHICGLGTSVPSGNVSPEEGLQIARVIGGPVSRGSGILSAVYHNSGNKNRYLVHGRDVVDDLCNGTRLSGSTFLPNGDPNFLGPTTAQRSQQYAREAPILALPAATAALKQSGFSADSITHLVTVSCTGFAAPGVDLALITSLGLPRTVERTNVGFMGCHGAINGLRVASALAADPRNRILMVAIELCSLHYHFRDEAEKVVANALFADGCAALVGGSESAPTGFAPRWRVAATGSCLIPETGHAMSWTIGDHGFEMTLAKQVPKMIAAHLNDWMTRWLADNGLSVKDVSSWAVHPGGPKILEAVEQTLELPANALDPSRSVFASHGNMSSPTVLFIINEMAKQGARGPCVMLGFGPGLTAEAVLLLES